MCLAIQQMREESELVGQIKGAVDASLNGNRIHFFIITFLNLPISILEI